LFDDAKFKQHYYQNMTTQLNDCLYKMIFLHPFGDAQYLYS